MNEQINQDIDLLIRQGIVVLEAGIVHMRVELITENTPKHLVAQGGDADGALNLSFDHLEELLRRMKQQLT